MVHCCSCIPLCWSEAFDRNSSASHSQNPSMSCIPICQFIYSHMLGGSHVKLQPPFAGFVHALISLLDGHRMQSPAVVGGAAGIIIQMAASEDDAEAIIRVGVLPCLVHWLNGPNPDTHILLQVTICGLLSVRHRRPESLSDFCAGDNSCQGALQHVTQALLPYLLICCHTLLRLLLIRYVHVCYLYQIWNSGCSAARPSRDIFTL
jgi:hypothetical protein